MVSFETIEHVTDAERALAELARVLAPGGLLVISTPNTDEYLVDNEFHTREFSHEEFVAFLEQRFPSVRLLYQHNWMLSAILEENDFGEGDESHPLELGVRKTVSLAPGRELYTVAVCGDDATAVSVPRWPWRPGPTRRIAWPTGWSSARRPRAAGTTSTRRPRTREALARRVQAGGAAHRGGVGVRPPDARVAVLAADEAAAPRRQATGATWALSR